MSAGRKGVVIGNIFGDALGAVVAPFVDVFTSVFDRIPGSDWAKDAVSNGASSIGDFAKTPVGFQVISVISGGASQALAPIVGPAIVNVAMATPGLVAGDDFTDAYTRGLVDYTGKAAAILTGGAAASAVNAAGVAAQLGLSPAVQAAAQGTASAVAAASAGGASAGAIMNTIVGPTISREVGKLVALVPFQDAMRSVVEQVRATGVSPQDALKKLGLDPIQVANQFGVRPDSAAIAENALLHVQANSLQNFDPITGLPSPRTAAQIQQQITNEQQLVAAYGENEAARFGGGQAKIAALQQELTTTLARDGGPPPPAPPAPPPPPSPPAIGYVRIARDPIPFSTRAAELTRLAALTAPFWGYLLLRSRKILP